LNIEDIIWINPDQFYGIEYEEFPARIAEVAMWLIDHQMNMFISNEFGQYIARLPLKRGAKIVHGNALNLDWKSLTQSRDIEITANNTTVTVNEPTVAYTTVSIKTNNLTIIDQRNSTSDDIKPTTTFDYILGNPPFIGSKIMTQQQRNEVTKEFGNIAGAGVLDYVTAWYVKAAKLIQNTQTKCAFVSTNSITQGEQVGILWNVMMNMYGIKIHFAHRTFKWSNEAKGNAAVYCVIIGFAAYDTSTKRLFEYEDSKGEAHEIKAKNINPYLVDAKDILIEKRSNPICPVPGMSFGNMPLDGGNLILSDEEKTEFLLREPKAEKFILPLISAYEFLNGKNRWCLWLVDAQPNELRQMPEVLKRIEAVKKFRLASTRKQTVEKANNPALFGEIRDFGDSYIAIPRVSSENRKHIPMGFFNKNSIISDTCMGIPRCNGYHFGILMSSMHMAWVKSVCGRLKSDFRYSKDIVYNNFPWPENTPEKQVKAIETAAQKVLDARLQFPNSSLADLYDPLTMPPALAKAHQELDKAVDLAYRPQPFTSEANRMVFLFELYEKYTANLFTKAKSLKKKHKN
jgi:hypothetical protein